jgi:hypothetical protein
MIRMNLDAAWVLAKAEKEDNGVVSVGGLICALKKAEEGPKGRLAEPGVETNDAINRLVAHRS